MKKSTRKKAGILEVTLKPQGVEIELNLGTDNTTVQWISDSDLDKLIKAIKTHLAGSETWQSWLDRH